MKQKTINALYALRECARRAVTPCLMYLFCGMLALAASAIPDENANVRLILVIVCVVFAAFLNVDQGIRIGRKHFQTFLSGEVRRSNGMDTIHNKDRNAYKYEMEYRWYKGIITGIIICIPLIIFCVVYAAGNYFSNENLRDVSNLVLLMFCGWAIIPVYLSAIAIDPNITVNVLWSLYMCALPILITSVSYIIGKKVEEKAYFEKQARIDSINNGEKPLSNREKKRRERENRKFR